MSYTNFKYVGQMSYSLYKAVLHPPKPILKLCIYGYYHYLKVVLKIEQSSQTDNRKKEMREEESGRSDKPINRRTGVKVLAGLLLYHSAKSWYSRFPPPCHIITSQPARQVRHYWFLRAVLLRTQQ
jgi:hypothetical protein